MGGIFDIPLNLFNYGTPLKFISIIFMLFGVISCIDEKYISLLPTSSNNKDIPLNIEDMIHNYISTVTLGDNTIEAFLDKDDSVSTREDDAGSHSSVDDVGNDESRVNLALKKKALQSSTMDNGDSSRAVDGNSDGDWSNLSVTHTGFDVHAWWEVDLDDSCYISVVEVYSRTDCCRGRLSNFDIILYDDKRKVLKTHHVDSLHGADVETSYFGESARIVRIQLQDRNFLELAEVRVMGYNNASKVNSEKNELKKLSIANDNNKNQSVTIKNELVKEHSKLVAAFGKIQTLQNKIESINSDNIIAIHDRDAALASAAKATEDEQALIRKNKGLEDVVVTIEKNYKDNIAKINSRINEITDSYELKLKTNDSKFKKELDDSKALIDIYNKKASDAIKTEEYTLKRYNEAKITLAKMQTEADSNNQKLKDYSNNIINLKTLLENSNKEIISIALKNDQASVKLSSMTDLNTSLDNNLKIASNRVDLLSSTLVNEQNKSKDLAQKLNDASIALKNATDASIVGYKGGYEDGVSSMRGAIKQLVDAKTACDQALMQNVETIKVLKSELDSSKKVNSDLLHSKTSLKANYDELLLQRDAMTSKLNDLNAVLTANKVVIDSINKKIDALKSNNALLEETKKNQLNELNSAKQQSAMAQKQAEAAKSELADAAAHNAKILKQQQEETLKDKRELELSSKESAQKVIQFQNDIGKYTEEMNKNNLQIEAKNSEINVLTSKALILGNEAKQLDDKDDNKILKLKLQEDKYKEIEEIKQTIIIMNSVIDTLRDRIKHAQQRKSEEETKSVADKKASEEEQIKATKLATQAGRESDLAAKTAEEAASRAKDRQSKRSANYKKWTYQDDNSKTHASSNDTKSIPAPSTNNGPSQWGNIDKTFAACNIGENQSPITLSHSLIKVDKRNDGGSSSLPPSLSIMYQPSIAVIENDSRNIIITDFSNNNELIVNGINKYNLYMITYHSPSEHVINNKRYALEVQYYHRNSDSVMIAVSVLYTVRHSTSTFLKQMLTMIPKRGDTIVTTQNLELENVMPSMREYYKYSGSLTTPPCTEGITWYVLTETKQVSLSTLKLLRDKLYLDEDIAFNNEVMGNTRPLQPLGNRVIIMRDIDNHMNYEDEVDNDDTNWSW